MKNANVESKKIRKAAKSLSLAGVQVRSGVKAGLGFINPPGPVGGNREGGRFGGRGGEPGIGR